jgi:heptosyltransferase-2
MLGFPGRPLEYVWTVESFRAQRTIAGPQISAGGRSSNAREGLALIHITPGPLSADIKRKVADVAALGVLVRISSAKRRLIRAVESVLRPIVRLVDWLRPAGSDSSPELQRILVVEYWNLGDIIMELPFLQNLRIQYPTAHIALLTSPKCVPLIADQGFVDEIIVVRVPWAQHYSRWRKYNPFSPFWVEFMQTLKTLRAKKFDLAFTARADIRENFILWLVNVRRRVGYGFGGGEFLLTDNVTPDLARPHFSNRWLRLLEHLDKPILSTQPRLRLKQKEVEWADRYLAERGIKAGEFIVAIHSGARSPIRQWGAENFAAVAERLLAKFPAKIVWFQDPGQVCSTPMPIQCVPLSLPLRQFMAILSRCGMFICNDSGPMHIATALDVPVVGIFGPTEPTWFGPLGEDHRIVIRPEFWCRPCFDYCMFDQPYCLRLITVESVFEAAETVLRTIRVREQFGNGSRAGGHIPVELGTKIERVAD